MTSKKKIQLLLPLLALLLSASACGGSPITFADIPLYTGAAEIQTGDSTMGDVLAETIAEAAGGEGIEADVRAYTLPASTTWDQVKAFYESEISGDDWMQEGDLTVESEAFTTIGWTRGSLNSEQALIAGYALDPFDNTIVLILGLFSE